MEIGFGGGRVNSTLAIDPTLQTASSASAAAVTEHHSFSALGWSVALSEGQAAPDTTDPSGNVTNPANGSDIPTGITTVSGTASDDISGVNLVRVQIRRLTTPREYWNGTTLSLIHI